MSIFCIGQSAYDIIVPMKEAIIENRKYRITDKFECGGGPAFNAACLCAMWGVKTYLISRLGSDGYGCKLREIALNSGVKLDYMIDTDDFETPYSLILTNSDSGARTLFNFPGQLKAVNYSFPDAAPAVILSDGHEQQLSLEAIKNYPRAISIIDAGTCRESTVAVAAQSDYIVCSEDFARQYTGKQFSLDAWRECEQVFCEVEKINHQNVIITMGDQGLIYRENGDLRHLKAYRVEVADTNGAGDIFHGAFAYGISKGMVLKEILELSSMAAALSVQTFGGQTSIPELETVDKMLS